MKTFAFIALIATALAAPSNKRSSPPARIEPVLSQYYVNSGAVDYNTGTGIIYKSDNSPTVISTLMSFEFPESVEGYNCQIFFPLAGNGASMSTGSQRAQVFSSLKPASETTSSWPSGNLRDQHLGDLYLTSPGEATWEATYGPYAPGVFPCPAGHKLGAEFVGRYDNVYIGWTQSSTTGPYVAVTA